MKLVIYPAVEPERLQAIAAVASGWDIANVASEAEAQDAIVDADALFGRVTAPMLKEATRLRWVQTPTVSLEHYMFPELVEHDCVLTNMRGLFSDIIADHVMGFVICFARNLHTYIRQQVRSHWEPVGGESGRSTFLAGPATVSSIDRAHRHLCDETVGIIGLGSIGRELAKRATAAHMRVIAVDAQPTDKPGEVASLEDLAGLDRLLAESHYVVVCAPHTPETVGSYNRATFQKMRSDGYFINIGRGATVVLDDLCAALEAGDIAGAALDVYETEPLPPEHPLWKFENVILTPHVAGYGKHIAERHLNVVLDNLGRFSRNEPLTNVVNKEAWY